MDSIHQLSEQLARFLSDQRFSVTTAESCTGGGIAQAITDIAGSSQWFSHGFVTYSDVAKQQLLGVNKDLIKQYGAVSQTVVEAMAVGALHKANADVAVAVSGIAGPSGGSVEKPIGTVWISCLKQNNTPISQKFLFSGDRKSVRNQSVEESLKSLIKIISKDTV